MPLAPHGSFAVSRRRQGPVSPRLGVRRPGEVLLHRLRLSLRPSHQVNVRAAARQHAAEGPRPGAGRGGRHDPRLRLRREVRAHPVRRRAVLLRGRTHGQRGARDARTQHRVRQLHSSQAVWRVPVSDVVPVRVRAGR